MRNWIAVLVLAVGLAGCGDGDGSGPDLPDLTRGDVAGQYEMTSLTFDPQGSLDQVDLLERLDPQNLPELVVASNKDSLQLIYREPGGLFRAVAGSYVLGDDGITVTLSNSTEPAELLLPRILAYDFDASAETLSFSGAVSADTTRLFALVPEWSGEPVTNPLPGTLGVTWTRN